MNFIKRHLFLLSGMAQWAISLEYPIKSVGTEFSLFAYGEGIPGLRVFAVNGKSPEKRYLSLTRKRAYLIDYTGFAALGNISMSKGLNTADFKGKDWLCSISFTKVVLILA
jgi:hypothetical protein